MIEMQNLSRHYGRTKALDDLSCQIEAGQVVGLLGPNGAGKSTLIKILTTFLRPSQGSALIDGLHVEKQPAAVRQLLGYLPEDAPLYTEMITGDFLITAGKVRGLRGQSLKESYHHVVERCGLEGVLHKPIEHLSKGYRQRVGLAQAIIHRPRFLILDEPTSGLDPNQVVEIRQLIKSLGQEGTVLFSSHILSEVAASCDRILVLNHGQLVADGTPQNLVQGQSVTMRSRASIENIQSAVGEAFPVKKLNKDLYSIEHPTDQDSLARLNKQLVNHSIPVSSLVAEAGSLEDIFAQLTHKNSKPTDKAS